MNLATFSLGGICGVGLVVDDQLLDLTTLSRLLAEDSNFISSLPASLRAPLGEITKWSSPVALFADMLSILHAYDLRGNAILALLQNISGATKEAVKEFTARKLLHPLNAASLSAPLPRPTSLRDGYAFRQHVETMRRNRGMEMVPEFDKFPVFYFGNHQSIFGPGDFPVQQLHLAGLDYELEVAVIIGKEGKNISTAHADEHIFGFTIMNDMSARTLQQEEMKLSLGPAKGKDFGTVLGPYLVTADALKDCAEHSVRGNRYALGMKASINGKVYSQGDLSTMNWTFAEIIERASYGVTLYPGDVIGSGTVGTGCLAELNSSKITDNLWLKPGDVVELEVERLGRLRSRIVLNEIER